jgi:hypothetical protein
MDRNLKTTVKWEAFTGLCCLCLILACKTTKNLQETPYIKIGEGVVENITSQDSFRQVTYRNLKGIVAASPPSGIFVANLCVNQDGIVEVVEVDTVLTTYKEPGLLLELLHAAKGYRYDADFTAPPLQCGKLTIEVNYDKIE